MTSARSSTQGVALYLRVSTEDQDLVGQERELRAYAATRGWTVVGTYREKASATGRVERRQFDQLGRDAATSDRVWNRVLVWALDRWSREPSFVRAIGSIEELERLGIRWHSFKEPMLDSGDDELANMGRDLLRGILPTIAAFEARRRSERTRIAMKEIREGRRTTRSGRMPGRQPKLTEAIVAAVVKGRRKVPPVPYRQLAVRLGIKVGTARRAFSLARRGHRAFVTPGVRKGP